MAKVLSWVLTDVERRIYVENSVIGAAQAGCDGNWQISKSRLQGGISDGVDVIEVNNGRFSFTVMPTRGMNMWHGSCDGCYVGWHSPVQLPVNPKFINLQADGGFGFLYGMNECMVHCGLHSNGVPGKDEVTSEELTLHGKVGNLPARYVEVQVILSDPVEIRVIGVIDETRFFGYQLSLTSVYSTFVGSNKVTVRDEITNWGEQPAEAQMLYHCNFGEPFMEKGAKAVIPSKKVVPRNDFAASSIKTYDVYDGYTPGYSEQCFFHQVYADKNGDSLAMLKNKAGDKAIVVRFNTNELPVFTQWKRPGGKTEGYVTGLEPGINFPNFKTFERKQGRVVLLQPNQVYKCGVTFQVCATADLVNETEAEIKKIMKGKKTTVCSKPTSDWVG